MTNFENARKGPFSRCVDFTKTNIWFLLAGLIGIAAAIAGFAGYYEKGYGVLNSAYSTWRLFILEWDWVNYPDGAMPGSIEFARWLAPVATFISIVKALQLAFKRRLQNAMFSLRGKHIVICGIKNGAGSLTEELLRKRNRVAIVVKEQEAMDLNELEELGAYIVRGNMLDEDTLVRAGVRKCKMALIMEQDDVANIGAAIRMSGLCGRMDLFLHLMDKSLEAVLTSSQAYRANSKNITLRIFNNYENTAKMLFRAYPLYRRIDALSRDTREPHLLIIGFGNAGEHILLQAIVNGHLPYGKRVRVTVLDRNARQRRKYFEGKYPQIVKHCREEQRAFKEMDVETSEFLTYIGANVHDINQIVICFDDDRRSLSTALSIAERARKELKERDIQVAVRIGKTGNIVSAVDDSGDVLEKVFCFGWMEQVASEDVIINESLDKMAKAAHDYYRSQNSTEIRTWEGISLFKRESNRAQVEHIDVKLHVLGFCAKAKGDGADGRGRAISNEEFESIVSGKKELLAMMEHERWNAFHYVNGWDTLAIDEIFKKYEGKVPLDDSEEAQKEEDSKKHACIVDWQYLDVVAEKLSLLYKGRKFDFKMYDRDHISKIPYILAEAGYEIYRKREDRKEADMK